MIVGVDFNVSVIFCIAGKSIDYGLYLLFSLSIHDL